MDIMTDLSYAFLQTFYDIKLFYAVIFFIAFPNFILINKMYEMKAYPQLIIPFPGYWIMKEKKVFWLRSDKGFPSVGEVGIYSDYNFILVLI